VGPRINPVALCLQATRRAFLSLFVRSRGADVTKAFVAYSHGDPDHRVGDIVEALKHEASELLVLEKVPYVFSGDWRPIAEAKIEEAEVFVYVVTRTSVDSKGCKHELAVARAKKRPRVLVEVDAILPGGVPGSEGASTLQADNVPYDILVLRILAMIRNVVAS
jgi:TIR domain